MTPSQERKAKLDGYQAAQRLHRDIQTKQRVSGGVARIPVLETIHGLDVAMLFQPLDGLLGAYLPEPQPGILISTKRDLHVQRFTAAHELGHHILGHKPSLDNDEDVGLWRRKGLDAQELGANAFASEFMLPKWLFIQHARRHSWQSRDLTDPANVYQLSLRCGASYQATTWALAAHGIITPSAAQQLAEHEPKALKTALLGPLALDDSWADVWVLSEHDNDQFIEGGPNDIFMFTLIEHASAGYLWDDSRLSETGFTLLGDTSFRGSDEVGGSSTRVIAARAGAPGTYHVQFAERRPWLTPALPLTSVDIRMDLFGKEAGMPRFYRKAALAA